MNQNNFLFLLRKQLGVQKQKGIQGERQKAVGIQKRNMKGEQIDMRGDVIRETLSMLSCSDAFNACHLSPHALLPDSGLWFEF